MKRYHKKVYLPNSSNMKLKTFTTLLNGQKWQYTGHVLDNLKYRDINLPRVLNFISQLKFDSEDIFEFYADDTDNIIKACYRVQYGLNMDIILVMANGKKIVTIYSNIKNDKHITLKKELYQRG